MCVCDSVCLAAGAPGLCQAELGAHLVVPQTRVVLPGQKLHAGLALGIRGLVKPSLAGRGG